MLDTDLVIRYVNPAYLQTTGRTRDELIGKYFFDALPENLGAPHDAQRSLKASLRQVLATGKPDTLVLQRYDIPAPGRPGGFEERWWSKIQNPLPGPDGTVKWVVQRAEDVTAFVRSGRARRLHPHAQQSANGPELPAVLVAGLPAHPQTHDDSPSWFPNDVVKLPQPPVAQLRSTVGRGSGPR